MIGLARDGHLIYGPHDDNGELWSSEDYDECNGAFLLDNSYAYAPTANNPYSIGCWGPPAPPIADCGIDWDATV